MNCLIIQLSLILLRIFVIVIIVYVIVVLCLSLCIILITIIAIITVKYEFVVICAVCVINLIIVIIVIIVIVKLVIVVDNATFACKFMFHMPINLLMLGRTIKCFTTQTTTFLSNCSTNCTFLLCFNGTTIYLLMLLLSLWL